MSHSQFHSTNLFILRHAWLNLWDKHMTTGRINQVTISQLQRWSSPAANTLYWPPTLKQEAFQGGRSLQGSRCPHTWSALWSVTAMLSLPRWSVQAQHDQQREHLIPRSHRFQAQISLSKGQGSPPLVRTTMDRQHLVRHAGSPGGSPSGYLTSGFSTSAINPHPSTLQTWVSESTDVRLLQVVAGKYPHIPTWHASSQTSTPWHAGTSMIWWWGGQPTHRQGIYSGVDSFYPLSNKCTWSPATQLNAKLKPRSITCSPQKSTYSALSAWGQEAGTPEVNPCSPPRCPSTESFQLPFM